MFSIPPFGIGRSWFLKFIHSSCEQLWAVILSRHCASHSRCRDEWLPIPCQGRQISINESQCHRKILWQKYTGCFWKSEEGHLNHKCGPKALTQEKIPAKWGKKEKEFLRLVSVSLTCFVCMNMLLYWIIFFCFI